MELLAGLEPATFCSPKKMHGKEVRHVGVPFFGDPVFLIFGRTVQTLPAKPKREHP